MSVFVFNRERFDDIFRTLQHPMFSGNGGRYTCYSTLYGKTAQDFDRLMRKLWIDNHKSYRDRYRTNQSGFVPLKPKPGKLLSPWQLLKTLNCLSYQIESDCDVLDKIIHELAGRLIDSVPEYEQAVWG